MRTQERSVWFWVCLWATAWLSLVTAIACGLIVAGVFFAAVVVEAVKDVPKSAPRVEKK